VVNLKHQCTCRMHVQTIPIMSVGSPIFIYTAIARIWGKTNDSVKTVCMDTVTATVFITLIVLSSFL